MKKVVEQNRCRYCLRHKIILISVVYIDANGNVVLNKTIEHFYQNKSVLMIGYIIFFSSVVCSLSVVLRQATSNVSRQLSALTPG